MTKEESKIMRLRDMNAPPFAEDVITTNNANVDKPYRYNAVNARLITRVLHKLELLIK